MQLCRHNSSPTRRLLTIALDTRPCNRLSLALQSVWRKAQLCGLVGRILLIAISNWICDRSDPDLDSHKVNCVLYNWVPALLIRAHDYCLNLEIFGFRIVDIVKPRCVIGTGNSTAGFCVVIPLGLEQNCSWVASPVFSGEFIIMCT